MTCLSGRGRVSPVMLFTVLLIRIMGPNSRAVGHRARAEMLDASVFCEWCSTHMCLNWKHTDASMADGNPKLKAKSWKTIFFKSRAKNILLRSIKKKTLLSQWKTYAEERGSGGVLNMLFWLKQTIPQSKPNFCRYAKYVPHDTTDRCNYTMVDVQIPIWSSDFSPSAAETVPTCEQVRPLRRTNQEQGSLFGLLCGYHCHSANRISLTISSVVVIAAGTVSAVTGEAVFVIAVALLFVLLVTVTVVVTAAATVIFVVVTEEEFVIFTAAWTVTTVFVLLKAETVVTVTVVK